MLERVVVKDSSMQAYYDDVPVTLNRCVLFASLVEQSLMLQGQRCRASDIILTN